MAAVHYESYTEARAHLKDLLDAAGQGRVATVRRSTEYAAVVDAGLLRHALTLLVPVQGRGGRRGRRHVRRGRRRGDRGAPVAPGEALPVDLVFMLINRVGLTEDQVAELDRAQGIARLQQFWTEGR
ncbi:hypothetical protein ACFY00_32735 [Kitasatospora sp. NPDC001540]|uniref:hypothetical protein n=1 Tax=Kitasatospora sp. NPDC001540 TaxID=3364014 RepID=UPI0036C034AC